jgi:hypothetical protein
VRRWAIPAAIIIAIEYLFALAVGARVGFHYRIPFDTYMILGLTVAVTGAALIIVVKLARYATQREAAPSARLMREAPYIASFAAGALLSALQISVLTWTKVMLPIASPFWADPLLANVDHMLFGADPWRIASAVFGWAAPAFDRAYVLWAPLKFGTFVVLILMPESPRKTRALIAYFLMMAAVAIGQFVLSSGGPVFYQRLGFGPRFHDMTVAPWVQTARDYLWQDYLRRGGDIGGGISAMPSLHVAASLWIALVWRSYHRVIGIVAFVYFATILVGSVLLGWHYGADGIAATAITAIAWHAADYMKRASGRRHGEAEGRSAGLACPQP